MSLFPKCTFEVLLTNGVLVAGARNEGTLVLTTKEPIPRVDAITLALHSRAWAVYGSGKNRSVVRASVFDAPFRVTMPDRILGAGAHRLPFAIDVPAWLPPGFSGHNCGIEHEIESRVDVDWAIDPVNKVHPTVFLEPQQGQRAPLITRSPPGFHSTMVLEVTLTSSVIAAGEPLTGQIALRGGQDARFDRIELSFVSLAMIVMGQRDLRYGDTGGKVQIPASALRDGSAVPFLLPASPHVQPSFRTSYIDHDLGLAVKVVIPWSFDIGFAVPVRALPRGSTMHGDAVPTPVGSERLHLLATAMAQTTGLAVGRVPTLVEGAIGPVTVRIADAPREACLGLDVDLTFPDVGLGIVFRALGMLGGLRESPLLPAAIAQRFLLRTKHEGAEVASFAAAALDGLGSAEEVRFSDHHVGVHYSLPNDERERMMALAVATSERARAIATAIGRLPFPVAVQEARAAWAATAEEQSAFLVPTGPSLHGIALHARVVDGQMRSVIATIRTVWNGAVPTLHVDVDLRGAPLPAQAGAALESDADSPALRAVRAAFPSAHVHAEGRSVTLQHEEWAADPRSLLPAIETFFDWLLDVRGERRTDAPYR